MTIIEKVKKLLGKEKEMTLKEMYELREVLTDPAKKERREL